MHHHQTINDLQAKYKDELNALDELRHACDLHILKNAKIIGMTTTGAAKNKNLLQELRPAIVIVEEAAEVLEAHIVTCLTKDTEHVIMIGDHQQLRPIPSVYMLAKAYNLDVSLFERLVKNGFPIAQLTTQHRMRPCISKLLVPHIYKELWDHSDTRKYAEIKGVQKNMFFLTHTFLEGQERDSTSRVNVHEAEFLVKFCKYLIHQGYSKDKITILATYSGQTVCIQKLLASDSKLDEVKATSVDNYQGEENDIILISFVRSNEDLGIGFLKTENRVCVALSRAKMGLYCIGNFRFFAEQSTLWKAIVDQLEKQEAIGPDIHIYCQNHQYTTCEVRRAVDFESAPEGGCTRPCEIRLPCGHKCPRMCHAYDSGHEGYQCNITCNKKTCKAGHRCPKKCFQCASEGCGPCYYRMEKELPCGHEIKVPCSIPIVEAHCNAPCTKLLACSHMCENFCGDPCTAQCKTQVNVVGPCGHKLRVKCFESHRQDILLKHCRSVCRVELSCGHKCKGTCSTCHQGRLHEKCKKVCGRDLVCGHSCRDSCSKNCPTCREKCDNHCRHSKCSEMCGVPCEPCREPCTWKCPHKQCTNLCGELCNREICFEPCRRKLICKHLCVGLCGEPCPSMCRICNKKQLTTIFFGEEDQPDARFLMLEDCDHIFEVSGFIRWLEQEASDSAIKVPRCPTCKITIRDGSNCLGNIVKTCLNNVDLVKKKNFGLLERNSRRQKDLKIMTNNLADVIHSMFKPTIQVIHTRLTCEKLEESRLDAMENYIRMIEQMNTAFEEMGQAVVLDKGLSFKFTILSININGRSMESLLDAMLKKILEFMVNNCKSPSLQQIQDLDREVHRFHLLALLVKAAHEADEKQALCSTDFQTLIKCCTVLTEPKVLPSDAVAKVNSTIKTLSMSHGLAHLNVTENEKRVIVRAIGLQQGHWFKCPNGHVYCIGECGGATEVARCGDCGAVIGGRDHHLEEGNSLAEEMDGAQFPAYSDAANMANYEPDFWFDRSD